MKKLYRSETNHMIAGICGGIGEVLAVNPLIIRILLVISSFFLGIYPLIFYCICWILIPPKNQKLTKKKLYRSSNDMVLSGLCGGIGERFTIDPSFIRIITALLCIFTGFIPIIISYIIVWLLIPLNNNPQHTNIKYIYRSKENNIIAGICAGIADFFSLKASTVRIMYTIICILTGIAPLVIAYILAIFIVPIRPYNNDIEIEYED